MHGFFASGATIRFHTRHKSIGEGNVKQKSGFAYLSPGKTSDRETGRGLVGMVKGMSLFSRIHLMATLGSFVKSRNREL